MNHQHPAFGNMEKVTQFTLNCVIYSVYKRVIFNTYCGERQNAEYAEVYLNGKWYLNTNPNDRDIIGAVMERLSGTLC